MEEKSKLKKLWEHVAASMRVQNKNPGCTACASPILDRNGKPVMPKEEEK